MVSILSRAGIDPWVVDFGSPEKEEGGLDRTLNDHVMAVSEAVDSVYAATGQPVSVAASSLIAPTVQISGSSALCPGAQTTLQASGNYAFLLWNTGAVGAQTSVNTAGSYWATATDALGCTVGTDTLVVTAAAPAAA